MKNHYYPLLFFNLLFFLSSHAQELPLGYILQYRQDFSKRNSLEGFNIASLNSWIVSREKQNFYLEFSGNSKYNPAVLSPKNIGVLSDYIFGDFILGWSAKEGTKTTVAHLLPLIHVPVAIVQQDTLEDTLGEHILLDTLGWVGGNPQGHQ